MDLIVRYARLRGRPDSGQLTTPSFVEPHSHLDKALTADRARENTTNFFEDSIALMRGVKRSVGDPKALSRRPSTSKRSTPS